MFELHETSSFPLPKLPVKIEGTLRRFACAALLLKVFYPILLKLHKYVLLPQSSLPAKIEGVLTKFCRATLLLADFSDFDPKLLFVLEGILGSLL